MLTREGVPALRVARRPLLVGEVTVPVGQTLDPELIPHPIRALRLRQFYEQRRLEPVNGPLTLRELYEQKRAAAAAQTIEPVTPVASKIVAGDLPAVPVAEEIPRPRPPKRRR
jgi:hypothetical protein